MHTRHTAPVVLITAVAAALALAASPAEAAKPVKPGPVPSHTTTLVGTDPFAAAQPTAAGHLLRDLGLDGGKLYVAYGDYDANTGPQQVHTFDPVSGQFSASLLQVPTEEISVYRTLNGKLYAPMTDPRDPSTSNVGYATNATGGWTNQMKAPAVHIYDVATHERQRPVDGWLGLAVRPRDPVAARRHTGRPTVARPGRSSPRTPPSSRTATSGTTGPPRSTGTMYLQAAGRHGGRATARLQRHHLVDRLPRPRSTSRAAPLPRTGSRSSRTRSSAPEVRLRGHHLRRRDRR